MESISPIPSPDYDAPSPQAGDEVEMELELPEEAVIDRTSAASTLASGSATASGGGDLNSRLDTFIQNARTGHSRVGACSHIFPFLLKSSSI